MKNTHYYQLKEEGYVQINYTLFNYSYFVNPLLSKKFIKTASTISDNPSKIEQAYSMMDKAISLVTAELGLVAQKIKNVNFIYVFEK